MSETSKVSLADLPAVVGAMTEPLRKAWTPVEVLDGLTLPPAVLTMTPPIGITVEVVTQEMGPVRISIESIAGKAP